MVIAMFDNTASCVTDYSLDKLRGMSDNGVKLYMDDMKTELTPEEASAMKPMPEVMHTKSGKAKTVSIQSQLTSLAQTVSLLVENSNLPPATLKAIRANLKEVTERDSSKTSASKTG